MQKRIVICCDGTWNSPEKRHVTNVVRTARAVLPADPPGKLHRSWTGMYRVKGRHRRPIGELPPELESIHPSVLERYDQLDGYRPPKLVEFLAANSPW